MSELLSPAGDFETALAAFAAGADAVYCGLADYSARAFAKNLSEDELARLVRYARANGRKVYVTFNTILDEDALDAAIDTLSRLEAIGPDAVIVQDLGVARLCRRRFPGLVLHASTQLVAHNLEGVLALGELGFARVVLARELSLDEISSIARRCGKVELECFIHGALCYSISGLCLYSALEKDRSGNRGQCAYCCRLPVEQNGSRIVDANFCSRQNKEGFVLTGRDQKIASTGDQKIASTGDQKIASTSVYPFSMKDLRLGEDARRLVDAGVVSLKIEGRMKSALYVASVTAYYRTILSGRAAPVPHPTLADLETVFSRRTTELYFGGAKGAESPVDPTSLGHLGAPIGSVKRITRDREGRRWLRFHTARALEKHDGLQFSRLVDGRHLGMGVVEMRAAISRTPVFEVSAGTDVEVLLPEPADGAPDLSQELRTGDTVYCSMSNAVKRLFPAPAYRPSDWPGTQVVDIRLALSPTEVRAAATAGQTSVSAVVAGAFEPAKNPDRTYAAAEKCFAKFGETDYVLGKLDLDDPERVFVPPSVLNDLRRDLVEKLDAARDAARRAKAEAAKGDVPEAPAPAPDRPRRVVRLRAGMALPAGDWDEVVVVIGPDAETGDLAAYAAAKVRLGLPVYTPEPAFNRLRSAVKRLLRAGYAAWEASDLATLRMLRQLGVADLTADWTLYAFNSQALALLSDLGVRRFTASPENNAENLAFLAESGYAVDFLTQQSTPLFISLTRPAACACGDLATYALGGLYVTTRPAPRTFPVRDGLARRYDLSWDVPVS